MLETIGGCRLHYEILRNPKPEAPNVLLLHGWGCDSTTFSFIQNALSEKATVITLDFPGHGQSPEPPEPWGVEEYADQVYALLMQKSLAPLDIVAHSFGGRVAIWLAANHPEIVRQLVITGGAGIRKPVSETSRRRTARFKRCNALLETLKKLTFLAVPVERMQTRLRNRYGSPDYVRLNETMRKTFVRIVSLDLLPLLPRIQAPTLLIWGGEDTETPLWMGQEMEKEIPDAGLVVFEGASHFAFMEQWQRFATIVKQFFFGGNAG